MLRVSMATTVRRAAGDANLGRRAMTVQRSRDSPCTDGTELVATAPAGYREARTCPWAAERTNESAP